MNLVDHAPAAPRRGRDATSASVSRGNATRRRLIETSERLFAEHGVDGVSIRAINQASGLGSASVHYHFGSKAALLDAVLLDQGHGVREAICQRTRTLASAAAPPTARQLVEAIALPYLELLEREPLRGPRWVRIVALITQTQGDALERLGEGAVVELFAQIRRAYPAIDPTLLARRWQVASEALIQMLSDISDQADELIAFVAGGVEAQLR